MQTCTYQWQTCTFIQTKWFSSLFPPSLTTRILAGPVVFECSLNCMHDMSCSKEKQERKEIVNCKKSSAANDLISTRTNLDSADQKLEKSQISASSIETTHQIVLHWLLRAVKQPIHHSTASSCRSARSILLSRGATVQGCMQESRKHLCRWWESLPCMHDFFSIHDVYKMTKSARECSRYAHICVPCKLEHVRTKPLQKKRREEITHACQW